VVICAFAASWCYAGILTCANVSDVAVVERRFAGLADVSLAGIGTVLVGGGLSSAAGAKVAAVLADLESAPVEGPLKATLRMLGKLTAEGKLSVEGMREVLAAGVSRQQVKGALAGCAAFNTTDGSPTPSASRCSAQKASR
jgi:hypothetical protein